MTKNLLSLGLVFFLLFVSCTDETVIYETQNDSLVLEENDAVLLNSVDISNSGVLDIYENEVAKSYAKTSGIDADAYPMTLVANIKAPKFTANSELAATHVYLKDDFLYISYNTAGDTFAGGFDIVNIADPYQPRLTTRIYYINADINAIAYEDGFVYVVGSVDSEKSVTATANAFISKLPSSNGQVDIRGELKYGFQEGLNANALIVKGTSVFVSSGREGYLTQYDKENLEIKKDVAYADLRSVIATDTNLAVLDADYGVRFLDDNLNETGGFAVTNGDFRTADKRTITHYNNKIAVAEGNNGAGIYNAQTGAFEEYLPILLSPTDASDEEVVTNAVAFNDDVFLMANGGAGLALSENESSLNLVGVIRTERFHKLCCL